MTNSERRVQRVRKALDPPGRGARRHRGSSPSSRAGSATTGAIRRAEEVWDELPLALADARRHELRPARGAGRASSGRARTRSTPARSSSTGGSGPSRVEGPARAVQRRRGEPPFEALDAEYPIRLTTGRRLESYNTGVQSNRYSSPLHRGESLDLSPEDAERLEIADGEIVRVSSRRGSVEAPVRIDPSLRAGLAFMTFHFPDEVDTNQLTIDATDPKSGTAEFKAAAIRVEKVARAPRGGVSRHARARRGDRLNGPQARPARGADAGRARCARRRPRAARVRLGGRCARDGRRGQHRARRARGPRAASPAAAGALGAAGADRLDQPRRPERDLPPADRAAGRRLRRRDLLRALRARAAPAARRPRLRRHRLPLPRLGRADRAARGALRARGRALRRRLRDLVPEPVPRPVRPCAGRARRRRRRRAARPGPGARRAPPRVLELLGGWRARACPRGPAPAGGRSVAAPPAARRAWSTRRASTTTARTAATRRCGARSSSARRASSAR